jgi:hypothetical protein
MSNLSTAIRYLQSAEKNPDLADLKAAAVPPKARASARAPRGPAKGLLAAAAPAPAYSDNAEFLAEVGRRLRRIGKEKGPAGTRIAPDGVGAVGLVGEYDPVGYALRRAQEVIRVDRTPSSWSHAFLFLDPIPTSADEIRDPARSPRIVESTFSPASEWDYFTYRSGASLRRFSDYVRADFDLGAAHSVPNVAVLSFGLTEKEQRGIIERALCPEIDQLSYDLPALLGTWFGYAMRPGYVPNPLTQGTAIPGAALVQLAYDAAGIDLSPGSHDRNTAPEHLWQTARFLYGMLTVMDEDGHSKPRRVAGYHCVRDPACLMAPLEAELPKTLADLARRR